MATALWTNAGLDLVATAVQTAGVSAAVTYVAIGVGCGTLATALTNGTPTSTLTLNAPGLPANIASGTVLVITDGVNEDQATVASPGASAGATSIPLTGYTPANNYAANTTGVAPLPLASDVALYDEVARVPANTGVAGTNPGESLNSGYFDGTQATNYYMQVGFFGGSTASATLGSGTLMIEDIQYWNHTINNDSNTYQADNTI